MIQQKGRPLRSLIYNSNKWRPLNKPRSLLIFAVIAKSQGTGKKTVPSLSIKCLQPCSQPFQCPPNFQGHNLVGLQCLFPILPLNQLGETTPQIRNESLSLLFEARATLSMLKPPVIKQPLPQSTKTFHILGVSNNLTGSCL